MAETDANNDLEQRKEAMASRPRKWDVQELTTRLTYIGPQLLVTTTEEYRDFGAEAQIKAADKEQAEMNAAYVAEHGPPVHEVQDGQEKKDPKFTLSKGKGKGKEEEEEEEDNGGWSDGEIAMADLRAAGL
jgi:hypothetical protein